MSIDADFKKLVKKYWGFLEKPWPVIEHTKHHRSEEKMVNNIGQVKKIILEKLGIIPVFFFLIVLFGTRDYVSPYRNVEKGLLILYHLIKGLSLSDMKEFIPSSSFNVIYHDFYTKNYEVLNQQISWMLENMFSNIGIRIKSTSTNPSGFKHVTLLLDGHDTRGISVNQGSSAAHYSYKLKKSGFRTQIMTDINDMVIFVSSSQPCADNNDGTMFVEMKVPEIMHKLDCLALDGGYPLFINQAIANSHLNDANFCYPVRKQRNIALNEGEVNYNKHFGSFRSKIESTFAEVGNTFERLNNRKYIRVSNVDIFNLQFKLACLLLNIKKFVAWRNISPHAHHSRWLLPNFDFEDDENMKEVQQDVKVETKLEHEEQMSILQQQFVTMDMSYESDDAEMIASEEEIYEIEKILQHRGEGNNVEYLVKWRGYGRKENSWEPIANFTSTICIEEYWKKTNRKQDKQKRK